MVNSVRYNNGIFFLQAMRDPEVNGGGKHILDGTRKDVQVFTKDKAKASERKKLKRQQRELRSQFRETKGRLKAQSHDSDVGSDVSK